MDALAPHGHPTVTTQGEWAGWQGWRGDAYPFEYLIGPFYFRTVADGTVRCAFTAERKHLNGSGLVHGGCLSSFADYAAYCIGWDHLAGAPTVTAALDLQFVGAAREGARLEARGDVVKAGAALVFVRGLISADDAPAVAFSAIIRRLKA